jgi:hypothetical protein
MGSFLRVDGYVNEQRSGVRAIYPTGNGVRLNADEVTVAYSLGEASDESNVFEVYVDGARSFITNWSGIQDISNERELIRVNRYLPVVQENGGIIWQYNGYFVNSSARLYPEKAVKVMSAGIGYEADGETDHNIFTVTMSDGNEFVTDWQGWQEIQNY